MMKPKSIKIQYGQMMPNVMKNPGKYDENKIKYTGSKFTANNRSGPSGSIWRKSAGNLSVWAESRLEWLDYRTPSCTVAKAKLT